jgi:asparagine synthase (glutamine-hydrolysing)
MGLLIGYWSNHDNNDESQHTLQRLLTQAMMGLGSTGLRVRSLRNNPSSHRTRSIFGIAVAGRHSVLQNTAEDDSNAGRTGLKATVAAAGADFEADIWAKASSNKLVLGRGIFGRATIFWTQTTNAVWFASRLELLLKVVERGPISLAGFYSYGCFSYVPAPLTPIKNVFSIRAGTEMTWSGTPCNDSPQTLELHQWREANEQISDEKEAARRLRVLLEESVEAQLKASTGDPIGVFLSGGLDSSVTAALLARAGAKLRLYTLDLGADCFSEVPYAESVARTLGTPLTKIQVTPNCLRRMLGSAARRLDGLYGDGVTIPLALMCERAS